MAINVHSNYYYMVEGSPHVWQLMCTVITTIWWRGALMCGSHVAINVHSNYYYMVEGSPHVWQLMCTVNYYYMVEGSPHVWELTCMVITRIEVEGTPHVWAISMHGSHTLIKICSYLTVSQRGVIKIHLKIPACESQHCLQSNLSQTHSYHGVKRTKQAKK